MFLFLSLAILLYAVPHAALYAWIRRALPPWPPLRMAVLLVILALMAAFYIGFALFRADHPTARFVLPLAFLWMALVFWAFCAGSVTELWNLSARIVPHLVSPLAPRRQILFMSYACLGALLWSSAEARTLRIRRFTLPLLPPTTSPLRIAHFSDLHLGGLAPRNHALRIVRALESLAPDMVLSSGDFMDAPVAHITAELDRFAALRPPYGKYGVLGNHEFYQGLDQALHAHQRAGFRLLRGEWIEAAPGLLLAGVDDRDGHRLGHPTASDENRALPVGPSGSCIVILLKHRPSTTAAAASRADLQLSGHTHGGQIFPFDFFVRLLNPRLAGWHTVPPRLRLYVSQGAGFWGPPLRLFAPPEITLIELTHSP